MYLEHIEVVGFRGINRLSLTLDENTLLIGENAWGKSSLLDALTLSLSLDRELYHFKEQDFYRPLGEEQTKIRHLQLVFIFCESESKNRIATFYQRLTPLWQKGEDCLHRIYLRLEGELNKNGQVSTTRSFLGEEGQPLPFHQVDKLVREVIRINPVLRLRDARFIRRLRGNNGELRAPNHAPLTVQLEILVGELTKDPQKLSDRELRQGLNAMKQLLDHYFAEHGEQLSTGYSSWPVGNIPVQQVWQSLENMNQMIARSGSRNIRVILLGLFSTLLQEKRGVILDPNARPLLLIENPETRLHPIMLSVAWGLLNQLPLQKVTTTNSGELLSWVPVEHICRLVRQSDRIATYRMGSQSMSSEESRRIAFHIRLNRASSLFARCWLLVEGETEVWLLHELARQCGYHFETEGIKVIEFAQCGLRPLIKFAIRMGIEWHVLVDGDEAGKKYATTTRSLMENVQDNERERLTTLPAPDMEHYLYRQGFATVYHQISGLAINVPLPMRKIIIKAIHRSSKPDLAIAVVAQAEAWGVGSIPLLLKSLFSRVVWLARGKAE